MIHAALFATGILAGMLGAVLGLGGGIFLVPALTVLFHFPIRVAVGASLLGVIATSAGVAAVAVPGRAADVGLALRLEAVTAAGAVAGGWLAGMASTRILSMLLAAAVFASAAYLISKAHHQGQDSPVEQLFDQSYRPRRWLAGLLFSSLAGMVSGLLGVGGGFIKVPVMYGLMGVPLGIATATSNFMVGITAAASVFQYYGRGEIYPAIVIPTAAGVLLGAALGTYLMRYLRVAWLRSALIGLLLLIGLQMVEHALQH